MSTELATQETAVAPSTFVNPLGLDAAADRIDALVNDMIDAAVGTIDDEIRRMTRRRIVAAAVRGIRAAKEELDGMDKTLPGTEFLVDSHRQELIDRFRAINESADQTAIEETVDAFLAGYRGEDKPAAKKRGKSSAGS